MGLFDFIKSAGHALGLASEETPPTAEDLKKELDAQNIGTEDVTVEVAGDKAIIKGKVADQGSLEKAIVAVGNSLGIAQVQSDVSVPNPSAPVFYTVKKGETLWKIVEEQYGKGKGPQYNAIFDANKPMLKHPDKIYPGQVLRIPSL